MSHRAGLLCGGLLLALAGIFGYVRSVEDIKDMVYEVPAVSENREPLYAGRTVGQTFRAREHTFSAVTVPLLPGPRPPTGQLLLHLRAAPKDTTDIRTVRIPAAAVRSGGEVRFAFPPLRESRNQTYALILEYPDAGPDAPLFVPVYRPGTPDATAYDDGSRLIAGTPTTDDMSFSLLHRERPLAATPLYGGLAAAGLALAAAAFPTRLGTPRRRAGGALALCVAALGIVPLFESMPLLGLVGWEDLAVTRSISLHAAAVSLLGPLVGTKVLLALLTVAGFIGMFVWLRQHYSTWASLFGAAIVAFSSFSSLHGAAGHVSAITFLLLPWLLVIASRRARSSWSTLAFFLGVLFLDSVPLLILAMLVVLLLLMWPYQRAAEPTARRIRMLLLTSGIAALILTGSARTLTIPDHARWPTTRLAIDVLLDPRQTVFAEKFSGQPFPWTEYGAYVGIPALLLAVVGVMRHPRRLLPIVIFGIVSAVLSGTPTITGPIPLWHLVDPLSVQRLIGVLVVAVAIASAAGLDALRSRVSLSSLFPRPWGSALETSAFGALIWLFIGDLLLVRGTTMRTAFVLPAGTPIVPHTGVVSAQTAVGLALVTIGFSSLLIPWTRKRISRIIGDRS